MRLVEPPQHDTLYYGDCLDVLNRRTEACVAPCYLDRPSTRRRTTPSSSARNAKKALNAFLRVKELTTDEKVLMVLPMSPFYKLFAGLLLVCLSLSILGRDASFLVEEGGAVESATVLLYTISAVAMMMNRRAHPLFGRLLCPFLIVAAALRELDFHQRFTTMGIFKSRFWFSPDVPVVEKLIAWIVILSIIAAAAACLRFYWRSLAGGLQARDTKVVGVFVGIGLAVVAKTLDGLPRKLEKLGISIGRGGCLSYH